MIRYLKIARTAKLEADIKAIDQALEAFVLAAQDPEQDTRAALAVLARHQGRITARVSAALHLDNLVNTGGGEG